MENQKLTDLEIALELTKHIQNPCGVLVNGEFQHIRPFYLRLARETLLDLKDVHAKDFLESIIKIYEWLYLLRYINL